MTQFDTVLIACEALSDDELTSQLRTVVKLERENLVKVLAHLVAFYRRELSGRKGYATLFDFCRRVLKYSSAAAYRRATVARAASKYPRIGGMIERYELALNSAAMLAKHLTDENHQSLLDQAKGQPEEAIERLVASLKPEPRKRDVVRACVAPAPAASPQSSASPPSVAPAASEQPALELGQPEAPAQAQPPAKIEYYRVSLDVSVDTMTLLNRARDLARHRVPGGEYDGVIKLALEAFLEKEDRSLRRPVGRPRKPKPLAERSVRDTRESRYIPERVKQEVWERDCGRCAYVGEDGVRCCATAWLELDHIIPRAWNGPSDDPRNVRLLCREHNALRAKQLVGELVAEAFGRPYGRPCAWPYGRPRGTSSSSVGLEPSKRQIQASRT